MSVTANVALPAKVEKIIKPFDPSEPERAQIRVENADHLYQEIRIENSLKDENGKPVRLKEGSEVEVIIEAPKDAVISK